MIDIKAIRVAAEAAKTDGHVGSVVLALCDEIESLRKDAARYRWLRDGNDGTDNQAMLIAMDCYGDEWDEAIDAAMESK